MKKNKPNQSKFTSAELAKAANKLTAEVRGGPWMAPMANLWSEADKKAQPIIEFKTKQMSKFFFDVEGYQQSTNLQLAKNHLKTVALAKAYGATQEDIQRMSAEAMKAGVSAADLGTAMHSMNAATQNLLSGEFQAFVSLMEEEITSVLGMPNDFSLGGTVIPRMSHRKRDDRFPGLTQNRRVVLDLTFSGHRTSSEIVDTNGELLGIEIPNPKYDPVPGAHVVDVPLGVGLKKLVDAGARFDLIVCDIPPGLSTPRVGEFADPRPPLNKTGRRLILPGVVIKKPEVGAMDLTLAAWRATNKLLSRHGEALLRMHVTDFNCILKQKEPGFDKIWYAHVEGQDAHVYLKNSYTSATRSLYVRGAKPTQVDRVGRIHHTGLEYTKGQREIFLRTLK